MESALLHLSNNKIKKNSKIIVGVFKTFLAAGFRLHNSSPIMVLHGRCGAALWVGNKKMGDALVNSMS